MELQIAAIKKPSVKPTPLGYLLQVSQTSFESKDRYMVLGGIIMNKGDIPQFNETMKKIPS